MRVCFLGVVTRSHRPLSRPIPHRRRRVVRRRCRGHHQQHHRRLGSTNNYEFIHDVRRCVAPHGRWCVHTDRTAVEVCGVLCGVHAWSADRRAAARSSQTVIIDSASVLYGRRRPNVHRMEFLSTFVYQPKKGTNTTKQMAISISGDIYKKYILKIKKSQINDCTTYCKCKVWKFFLNSAIS